MKSKYLFPIFVIFYYGLTSSAQASNVSAATFTPSVQTTGHSGNGSTTLGWMFNVNQTISVTALGYYDSGANGLIEEHSVGIFDSIGNLISSALVPSGTSGVLETGFRYTSITPFTLVAGTYTIGASIGATANDPVPYNGSFATIPQISIPQGASRYTETGTYISLSYPNLKWPVGNPYPFYLGPNFQVAAVPIPTATWLFLSGLFGILFKHRKTRTT